MKKFSRLCSGTLAILMGISLLAGCTAKNNTAPSPTAPKERIKIKYWEKSSGPGPISEWIAYLNTTQNEFQYTMEGFGDTYSNILNLALQSGDPPEIFNPSGPILGMAETAKIVPIDDIVTADFKAQFDPSTFKQNTVSYNGKIYTVPLRLAFYKLLYNKDIFKKAGLDPNKPPQTLEEMKDYAIKINTAGKGEYYGYGLYINYGTVWQRHLDVLSIAHGDTGPAGFDFVTGKFDFSKQKKYFDYWVSLYKDGGLFPGAISLGVDQMRANFAAGKVGMMIDGSWLPKIYAKAVKTDADWDAAVVPIFAGAKRAKDFLTCDLNWVVANSTDAKKVADSKRALKYMLENQLLLRKFGDSDPKTLIAANTKESVATLPKDMVFRGLTEMANVSNHVAFPVDPSVVLKVEGDGNEKTWTNAFALAIDGKTDTINNMLVDLSKRYNLAADKAVVEGRLTADVMKPANFDYFKR